MSRTLAGLLAVLMLAPVAVAQRPQPGEPIPLTLSPAGLASPALKYRLLPAGRDLVPGNAATLYYRSLGVFAENQTLLDELNAGYWDTWLSLPLAELPLEEMPAKLDAFQGMLTVLDEAARRRQCDWQLSDRPEGIRLLLPEVQKSRNVSRIVAVRARYRLATGHFPEAVQSLQTGYALGRHLAQGPTLIQVLVGLVIVRVMDDVLEEILQQPGAPNLYWALAVLPRPCFDPLPAIDQEETALERTWPVLGRLEEEPLTPKQVEDMREQFHRFYRMFNFEPPTALDVAATALEQARTYPEARKALMAAGVPADRLDAMPPFQVLTAYCLREYHRTWDDYVPWVHVPHFGRQPAYRKARDRAQEASVRLERLVLNPKGVLSTQALLGATAVEKVYAAIARSDRRHAAQSCVEALRLYAAGHGGRLPASLKDVTEVPVPDDPRSGKPFFYAVQGDRAKLAAPMLDGDKVNTYERLTYDITLRR
jgi:hypothetical protein